MNSDSDLEEMIFGLIGLFVLSCLVGTLFYGWSMVVACLIGLAGMGALLNAVSDSK